MSKLSWNELARPHVHLGSFLLRIGLAIIFIWHGYLKLVQSHGTAWSETLPEGTQLAVAWGETICGLALLVGLLSRLAALGIVVIMVGAMTVQTAKFGFITIEVPKPNSTRIPTGTEYNFALIVMALGIVALGSDPLTLDHLFFKRRQRQQPGAPGERTATGVPEHARVNEAAGFPREG